MILLINPPWFILEDAKLGQNSTPLGLCYLAAAIAKRNYEVAILNAERTDERYYYEWTKELDAFESFRSRHIQEHPVWEKLADKIKSLKPKIVGITIRTPAVESALYLCELIKNIDNEVSIIVGGPHPTALPEEMLASEHIDFVVRGEGEDTFVELIEKLRQGHDQTAVRGLSYRLDGNIVHNPDRPLMNMSDVPHPAKNLMIDLDKHDQDDFNPIMASRGCPYRCIFCASANVWSRNVRFREPIDVVNEIAQTHERFDTRFFSFDDDTFTLKKERCMEICRLIVQFGLNKIPGFRWTSNTRPELLSPDLLDCMKSAGCAAVAIGIESGNNGILKRLRKSYTTEQIRAAAAMIKQTGMVLAGQFIIGFPFETESEMWDTVKLAEDIEAESVKLSIATPFPKTELYDLAKEKGYFPDGINWSDVMLHNDGILFNKIYSEDQKNRIMEDIISEFRRIQEKTIKDKISRIEQYESLYKLEN